ncbi:MAG: nucleoside hydrolase [Ardenticatenia bacterium]|nr:MAG: nucleoside hydrolase [Ardenticatenia bacterium]
MRPLFVDTDVGVDDAIALLMLLHAPDIAVVGIGGVQGNCPLDAVMRNIAIVLNVADAPQIPVYRGAATPLMGALPPFDLVHGDDGLGGVAHRYPAAPIASSAFPAAMALVETARAMPGDLDVLALGPLTNIALAMRLDPDLPRLVRRFIIMGGALTAQGNVTPVAEFNIWADAEAAKIVLESEARITLVTWEATLAHTVPWERWHAMLAHETPTAHFVRAISAPLAARCRTEWGYTGMPLPDPLAAAVVLRPEAVQRAATCRVAVETAGLARGLTVPQAGAPDAANVFNIEVFDTATWHTLLERTFTHES